MMISMYQSPKKNFIPLNVLHLNEFSFIELGRSLKVTQRDTMVMKGKMMEM